MNTDPWRLPPDVFWRELDATLPTPDPHEDANTNTGAITVNGVLSVLTPEGWVVLHEGPITLHTAPMRDPRREELAAYLDRAVTEYVAAENPPVAFVGTEEVEPTSDRHDTDLRGALAHNRAHQERARVQACRRRRMPKAKRTVRRAC